MCLYELFQVSWRRAITTCGETYYDATKPSGEIGVTPWRQTPWRCHNFSKDNGLRQGAKKSQNAYTTHYTPDGSGMTDAKNEDRV